MELFVGQVIDAFPIMDKIYKQSTMEGKYAFWFYRQHQKIGNIVTQFQERVNIIREKEMNDIPAEKFQDVLWEKIISILNTEKVSVDIEPRPEEYLHQTNITPAEINLIRFLIE